MKGVFEDVQDDMILFNIIGIFEGRNDGFCNIVMKSTKNESKNIY